MAALSYEFANGIQKLGLLDYDIIGQRQKYVVTRLAVDLTKGRTAHATFISSITEVKFFKIVAQLAQ